MDLSLSDEQKQLQDAAERFVRDKYAFENRRKIAATEKGFLPENWAQMAELGWLGMAFSEEDGGYGGGPIETMIVMEQFGKGLVLEPFLPTVVLGGGMIANAGSKDMRIKSGAWRFPGTGSASCRAASTIPCVCGAAYTPKALHNTAQGKR